MNDDLNDVDHLGRQMLVSNGVATLILCAALVLIFGLFLAVA